MPWSLIITGEEVRRGKHTPTFNYDGPEVPYIAPIHFLLRELVIWLQLNARGDLVVLGWITTFQ